MKILVSVKKTKKEDEIFYLWRPQDSGYTSELECAGQYEKLIPNHHDSENTIPIGQSELDSLDKRTVSNHYGLNATEILNNEKNRTILGVKIKGRDLIRFR